MKVKELVNILRYFSPDADVTVNIDGQEHPIIEYSWYNYNGADSADVVRNVEKEKFNADAVSLGYEDDYYEK